MKYVFKYPHILIILQFSGSRLGFRRDRRGHGGTDTGGDANS